jgi:hypothetical protein
MSAFDAEFVRQLALLVTGSILTLLATQVSGRLAAQQAREGAHRDRVFQLKREAYAEAQKAWTMAQKFRYQTFPLTEDRNAEICDAIVGKLNDARLIFGLPTSAEEREQIIDAYYDIAKALDEDRDTQSAVTELVTIVSRHVNDIRDAWERELQRP